MMRSFIIFLLAAAATGCGSSRKTQATAPTMERTASRAGPTDDSSPRADIEQAWRELDALRTMAADQQPMRLGHHQSEPVEAICGGDSMVVGPEHECRDHCAVSSSICESAEKICRLADELAADTWAMGKCSDAKSACEEAQEQCCECVTAE